MSRKIIGVTVGTPISARKIEDDLKPVKTVNGKAPDVNGNINIDSAIEEALAQAKESGEFDGKSAYAYAQDGGYAGTEAEFAQKLAAEHVPLNNITLGIHTDGLVYIFVNGSPVGSGVEMQTSAPISGYIDSENNLILKENTPGALPDGEYTAGFVMEDGSIVTIGQLVKDTNVYYSVTNTLTNCTTDNSAAQVIEGEAYTATITANDGYELKSVSVTMGGEAVSVSGGSISIAEVTGNIVITAVAEESVVAPSYTNYAKNFEVGRLKSGGTVDSTSTAATTCSDYIPFTQGTVVRVKGFGALTEYNVALYDSSKVSQSVSKANAAPGFITYAYDSASGIVTLEALSTAISLLRVSGILTGTTSDVIITVNEEIV